MFAKNLVMSIKVGGKVLREVNDIVHLPFGTEYSILLKNLDTRKVKVCLKIDGSDATGGGIVIDAGKELELKRFLNNSNLEKGNAFKFIEKDAKVSAHRGDKAEDGLVTATFEFEHQFLANVVHHYPSVYRTYPFFNSDDIYRGTLSGNAVTNISAGSVSNTMNWSEANANASLTDQLARPRNSDSILRSASVKSSYSAEVSQNSVQTLAAANTAGITAPGSVVQQKFSTTTFYGDGQKHAITLQLKGGTPEKPVTKPVTVKRTVNCTMCGTSVRQTAKFCHHCGASVELVV